MKIRAGFVSNSSSSSFIMVGRSLTRREVADKAGGAGGSLYWWGWVDYGDNDMLFRLDKEMLDLIRERDGYVGDGGVYEVYAMGDGDGTVIPKDLPEGAMLYGGEVSNFSLTAQEFKEHVLDED